MLPGLRRALLLLYAIPKEARESIHRNSANAHAGVGWQDSHGWLITKIDEQRNCISLKRDDGALASEPLDAVTTAYCKTDASGNDEWHIFIVH
jgi:hypothetical protein